MPAFHQLLDFTEKSYWFHPDCQRDTTFLGVNLMLAVGRIDDEAAFAIQSCAIALRAVQNQNMFKVDMLVAGH